MSQIGNIPEIIKVKDHLDKMMQEDLIKDWELPYENLLTRISAAIFFLSPMSDDAIPKIKKQLQTYENFHWRANVEKKLSHMEYRIEFNDI